MSDHNPSKCISKPYNAFVFYTKFRYAGMWEGACVLDFKPFGKHLPRNCII